MLTQKLFSRTVALAMTASMTVLAGCPAPVTVPTPSDSGATATATPAASASASASTAPTATATATPATTATPVATTSATATPSTPTNSTLPSGQTGATSDVKERATFNGKVYDPNNVPVEGARVTARSIDPGVDWVGEEQVTIGGAYVFRNAPVGSRIAITVTKDGWTTRDRAEVLKSNLQGDPTANVFNFSDIYAIQDEPEITALKVNGRQVLGSTSGASFLNGVATPAKYTGVAQLTTSTYNPSLTGVANNTLEVEMTFSEPVRRDDVENYFRVSSQVFTNKNNKTFSIDQNLAGVGFTWANDDKSVVFKTNKAILANKDGDEARYAVEFTQAFRDKTDKAAKSQRYFRFSPSQINDFAVFSVKNDDQAPALLSILARDGGSSADTLELRFSEPMEVINQSSVAAGLADPAAASDTTRQLWSYSTTNAVGANNATVLGYKNAAGNFVASYVVGRILSADINNAVATKTVKLSALGTASNAFPTTLQQYAGSDTFGYRLRSARITGNTVLIELTPQAFDRDDRVIVSAGTNITANYSDRSNNVGPIDLRPALNLPSGADFATIQDPSGRTIDGGNSTTSANIDVNNQQRVSTVN